MRDLDYRCHFLIEPLERRDALSTVAGGGIVTTVGQVIPNFGANPTDYSMASGNWSNPAIWSAGRVPVAGDVVQIAAGTRINYDANSPAVIATVAVEPGGELDFATSVSTRLVVGNLLVMEGGTLTIGTPTNPVAGNVRAEVDFSGSLNKTADPQQYGIGLIGLGTVIVCGSPLSQTWLPLANEPKAGDTALALSAPVSGWRPGDTLLIPDSREMNEASLNPYVWEGDMPTIAAVSQDGRTVTLAAPLKYSHPGAHDAAGLLDDTPGVADLSRNVVFKSIGGTPGHVMFVDRAAVDVAFAELDGLGRTTVQPLGSTNIRDRDAIDLDNLMGPAAGQVGGGAGGQREFQFQLTGCVVNGSPKIGIALQNASFGLLSGNVVFNADGAGIMLEDGGEVQNTIAGNFTGLNVGDNRAVYQGADTGDFGHEGVGFWFRDQDNYVTGNVATDARHADFTISEQPGAPAGSRSVPSFVAAQPDFPGANLADPSQTTLVDVNSQGVLEFAGNEAYGGNTSFGGLYLWQAGIDVGQAPALTKVPMSTIQGFVAWNVAKGINSQWADDYCIDGYVYRGAGLKSSGVGFTGTDRIVRNFDFGRPDVQGASVGFVVPTMEDIETNQPGAGQAAPFSIEGGRIDCLIGVSVSPQFSQNDLIPGDIAFFPPINVSLAGVDFSGSKTSIDMNWTTAGSRNLIAPETVLVANYNGVADDDFQVYYAQQSASAVLPASAWLTGAISLVGAPFAGLTNGQALVKFGVCAAGQIAPASAHSRAGILGLVN